jgi:hypothetical protein
MQASIASGNTPAGTSAFCGTTAQLLAKIERGAFKLFVEANSSDSAPQHSTSAAVVQTNISIACRTTVPNGGALIASNPGSAVSGTNYCMIISCIAIDAKGDPIKLEK